MRRTLVFVAAAGWLTWFYWPGPDTSPPTRAWYTTDDGLTWSPPVEVTQTFEAFRPKYDWKVIATGPDHGIQLKNGRLLVPLTNADRWGGFLMITRRGADPDRYAARFAGRVGIIPCVGGRDPAAEERLTAALAKSDFTAVRSLRRAPDEPDHTCWLAGEGWWLSTAPASSSR